MNPRVTVGLVLAALVVVAGCSALPGGSSRPEPQDTVTPVPVTTATESPTATPRDLPPGVGSDGTVDVSRLIDAHTLFVGTRTYTWTFRYVAIASDGSVDDAVTRRVVVGPDEYLVDQETPGSGPNQTLYVTDVGYLRTIEDGETRYEREGDPLGHTSYTIVDEVLWRFVPGVGFDVDVVERNGETFYRLHSNDFDVPTRLDRPDVDVRNFSATIYVTSDGFVRTVAAEYDREWRDIYQTVRVRFDYEAVGETTLAEPEWISQVTPTPQTTAATTTAPPTPGTDNGTETATAGPQTANGTNSTGD